MSDAEESRKDDLVVSVLSRLPDPTVPDGLAARIKTMATAAPQLVSADQSKSPILARRDISPPADVARRAFPLQWPVCAAASVAALLLFAFGILGDQSGREAASPIIVKGEVVRPLLGAEQIPNSEVAVVSPGNGPTTSNDRLMRRPAKASIAPFVPDRSAQVEPVAVDLASGSNSEEGQLANHPADDQEKRGENQSQVAHGPVYGPPAPSDVGFVGSANGSAPTPLETGYGIENSRGVPPSAPPSAPPGGFPAPSGPRGPGSRH